MNEGLAMHETREKEMPRAKIEDRRKRASGDVNTSTPTPSTYAHSVFINRKEFILCPLQ